MKLVVADTSPINYLVLIDCIDLLRILYSRIIIPDEVWRELTAEGAPNSVAAWIRSKPDWIEIRTAPLDSHTPLDGDTEDLDPGERAAIQLARGDANSLLLIDEAAGRACASRLGVATTGTVGVLMAASRDGLVDLRTCLDRLQRTNFRISQSLIAQLLGSSDWRR